MSKRALTTGLETETLAAKINVLLLGFFDFASGAVRVWNGYGQLSWGGNTYEGLGEFVSVSAIEEAVDLAARGVTFQLTGVPSSLIALVLADAYQGREASLWMGAMSDAGAVVVDPFKIFSGRMDVMEIMDTGDTSIITLNAENRLIDLRRIRESRYTDAEQQRLYPGDRGCEYVAGLQDKQLPWGIGPGNGAGGGAITNSPGPSGGGGGVTMDYHGIPNYNPMSPTDPFGNDTYALK